MMANLKATLEELPPIVLKTLQGDYGLLNLPSDAAIPDWVHRDAGDELVSLTRSVYGFSIICPDKWVPQDLAGATHVAGWRALRVEQPRDWAMHGLYSRLAQPLSDDAISIYLIGAYNADHILVRGQDFSRAIQILSRFCDFT
ncbi:MAG TPA: ACT domain-containing protein [Alphaproteobacteria bacterium]|nr:ACT domain-containing protein [Alphaproteobacteria bacterium]